MARTHAGELLLSRHPISRAARGAVAVAALASVASCAGETSTPPTIPATSGNHAPTTPGHQTARPSGSSKPTEAACQLPNASLAASKRFNGSVALSSLVGDAVRLGAHDTNGDCYDSFVIALEGSSSPSGLPGFNARYVEGPIKADPSDQTVQVRGKYFLQITVGAAMGASIPHRLSSAAVPGVEAALTENFEGVTTWTLGLDERQPFTVSEIAGTAADPGERLVVNIQR